MRYSRALKRICYTHCYRSINCYNYFENSLAASAKTKYMNTLSPSCSSSRCIPNRNMYICSQTDMHKNVPTAPIHNILCLRATQMSTKRGMHKLYHIRVM